MFCVEMTDTFGGEPNYCWVRRAQLELPDDSSDARVIRAAKRALGISGRHVKTSYGDTLQLRVVGACIVIFIEWCEVGCD